MNETVSDACEVTKDGVTTLPPQSAWEWGVSHDMGLSVFEPGQGQANQEGESPLMVAKTS